VDANVNSLELGWTEVGSATSWEIAYGDLGFDPNDAAEATYITATTNPFTVQNLTSATSYQFYVRALCGANDVSYWSNPTTGSTTMQPVSLPYTADFSDPTDEWTLNNGSCANYWVRGTVDNDAALFVTDNGTTPNYNISSASMIAAQKLFTVGTNDSITITFDVQVQGESSFDYMKLFLAPSSQQFPASTTTPTSGEYGYNSYSTNAYDFYNHGYGSQSSYPYIMNIASGTVHVVATMPNPNANPTSTSTALLVFAWKNDLSVGTQPPATITNLTVTADGSGPGPVITDPTVATTTATAIAQTTATLNGTITNPDNVTITAKGFEWKTTVGGTYQPVTVTGNNLTYNLTGLTANTGYTYKAFITYNGTTVYGNEVTFTTLPEDVQPCNVPTGLTAGEVTKESIAISWDNDANVNSWNIQYRPVGGTLSSATATTNSYTITGLTPETQYQIQVQADCGDGNVSDWSSAITVTTLTDGIENYLLNSISLYPNPAKEYIDVRVDELNVTSMEVFDVYGKLINTVNVIDNPTRINVSNLAAGMYFVRVTTEQGVATKSFVKK
jgi:chitodextrinase